MAKERLSKLQKWILKECYHEENGQIFKAMRKIDIFRYFKNSYFIGSQELPIITNFKAFMAPEEYNKACATISRSLRGLRDKGFVRLIGKKVIEESDYDGAIELAMKYKTEEELRTALKAMDPGEMQKMADNIRNEKYKKIEIAVEIKGDDKANVRIVELTDLGIKEAKELLKLSS